MKIKLENIIPDPNQPRKTFNEDTLDELQSSFNKIGLIQPITVRPTNDDKYMIVVGERRYRAAQKASIGKIECIIRDDIDSKRAREMQFAENYHLEPLTAYEQAEAWVQHIQQHNMTMVMFANTIGVDETTVRRNMALIKQLHPALKESVISGKLTKSHAEVIATIPNKQRQVSVAKPIIEGRIGGSKAFTYIAKAKEFPSLSPDVVAVQVAYNTELHKANGQIILNELKRQQIPPIVTPVGKYRTIVIDPPWPIEKILREKRPHQFDIDYPTMTLEEITKFPIPDLASEDGCHIYLWTTQKHLHDALHLFETWDVNYQCLLTWVKNVGFTPFSWMYSTEHCLFGRIGSLQLLQLGKRLDFQAKVREHSRKPEEFYELVRKVSPEPRIDVFSREKREGFAQYGNEPKRFSSKQEAIID